MEQDNPVATQEQCIIFEDDPRVMNSLVDHHVTVNMIKSCSHSGFLHAVDPITKSLILSVPKDNDFQTILIPGHAIISIKVSPPPTSNVPKRKVLATLTEEEIADRREKSVAWLKKNFLPAKIKDGIIDLGNVSILAPFSSSNVCTNNPIIAGQITKILDSMPTDFVP